MRIVRKGKPTRQPIGTPMGTIFLCYERSKYAWRTNACVTDRPRVVADRIGSKGRRGRKRDSQAGKRHHQGTEFRGGRATREGAGRLDVGARVRGGGAYAADS